MFTPRKATDGDISEIIRLAMLMWNDMGFDEVEGQWQTGATEFFSKGFRDGESFAYVVDDPHHDGRLVAIGCGTIYSVVPAFWLPSGKMGYAHWFFTDEQWRRRGIAGQVLDAVIAEFRQSDITRVQLHATESGVPLYVQRNFEPSLYANYWLTL
jgi:GNAT superfamily N-acetyltransferase